MLLNKKFILENTCYFFSALADFMNNLYAFRSFDIKVITLTQIHINCMFINQCWIYLECWKTYWIFWLGSNIWRVWEKSWTMFGSRFRSHVCQAPAVEDQIQSGELTARLLAWQNRNYRCNDSDNEVSILIPFSSKCASIAHCEGIARSLRASADFLVGDNISAEWERKGKKSMSDNFIIRHWKKSKCESADERNCFPLGKFCYKFRTCSALPW